MQKSNYGGFVVVGNELVICESAANTKPQDDEHMDYIHMDYIQFGALNFGAH
jgi:hypothetical protein